MQDLEKELEKTREALATSLIAVERRAYDLAVLYHEGQVDKLGAPYMEHIKAVAQGVSSVEEKIVAFLHDILEDTICTREVLLAEGIPAYLIDSVESMTRREGETYKEFIRRVSLDAIARAVKLSDLKHNLDESGERHRKAGYEGESPLKPSLRKRYLEAIGFLSK